MKRIHKIFISMVFIGICFFNSGCVERVNGKVIKNRVLYEKHIDKGSSGAGGAIVGGLLFGLPGAVVGGLATRDKRQVEISSIASVKLLVRIENKEILFFYDKNDPHLERYALLEVGDLVKIGAFRKETGELLDCYIDMSNSY